VLLGTTSIAKSELISAALKAGGIEHNVLNAKQHEREAEIITQAGRKGAVTVATNMAGRGTDIVLGGKADALWEAQCKQQGLETDSDAGKQLFEELSVQCKAEQQEVLGLGGLYVLGTERHEARRIDNQLRGRCGRQGDPGQTKFFLSFDDDLMRIFARDWVRTMMERMGLKSGEVIDSPMVSRGIAKAQKKVEARNFDVRKHLIEYDEVMDKQRKFIYTQRQDALEYKGLRDKVLGMFEEVLEPIVSLYSTDKDKKIDYEEIRKWIFHRVDDGLDLTGLEEAPRETMFQWIMERVEKLHDVRAELYGDDWNEVLRFLILETIDNKWKDHLYAMDVLKQGVGLRSYAQVDPKNEYKKEGFEKFGQLKVEVADHICSFIYKEEATNTIRDVVTGKMQQQQQQPQQQQQMPQSPEELQALFEQLIEAGKVPQEILDRMASGEKFQLRATPQGLALQQIDADNSHIGSANPGEEPTAPVAPPQATPSPAQRLAPARQLPRPPQPQQAKPAPIASRRAPGAPKPGRNDSCPCGSGVKYKKCCAPHFD
jgi:preprotein translocase subunit SecA